MAKKEKLNYEEIVQKPKFKQLMDNKKKFIVPFTIFFLIFYFTLPIMTSYSEVLNTPAIGDISWVWIFAIAQFVMTWTLCTIYVRRFAKFDVDADDILKDEGVEQE
ncbi:MAG TPA: DUF485 domain-containing protein [Pseudogracilibacillus sp.]|nr:DUF485 domain-containing protein [Pseudogracilibacillus sp.]